MDIASLNPAVAADLERIFKLDAGHFSERLAAVRREISDREYERWRDKKRAFCTYKNISDLVSSYYAEEAARIDLKEYQVRIGEQVLHTLVYAFPKFLQIKKPSAGILSQLRTFEARERIYPPEVIKYASIVFDRFLRDQVPTWNGTLYRLQEVSFSGEATMIFSLADYFEYRLTCGLLGDEVYEALIQAEGNLEEILAARDRFLPLRKLLLPDLRQLAAPQERLCCGGIGVLFAAARGEPFNDYVIPLQIRSAKVGDNANMFGVMPIGFHQPLIAPGQETGIYSTVLREIYEEIFDGHEMIESHSGMAPDWYISQCPPMAWLRDHQNAFDCEMVSFGFYARAGEYECNLLMAIHDPEFWTLFGPMATRGWEAQSSMLISSRDEKTIKSLLFNQPWASESLFHFSEGLRRLKEMAPAKVNLPGFDCGLL